MAQFHKTRGALEPCLLGAMLAHFHNPRPSASVFSSLMPMFEFQALPFRTRPRTAPLYDFVYNPCGRLRLPTGPASLARVRKREAASNAGI